MATQQRTLEVLRQRVAAGERPAVLVGPVTYAFSGVVFGGPSPSVILEAPDGTRVSKTAAAWTRDGAELKARSRNLAADSKRKSSKSESASKKSPGQLDREISEMLSVPVTVVVAWTEDTQEIAPGQKTWRHDLGERPKLVDVKKPHAAMWVNAGSQADIASANRWIAKDHPDTGRVFVYPTTESDPLGRARRNVFAQG